MQGNASICSLIVLGALLGLSGCGSSGSGTEDAGVQPPPPPPPSAGETVVVSGKVTDMPIANATVLITVDGQTFQAPLATDAQGNFEVEIQSGDPDALVKMEAFDPNGSVYFTALADSFAGLQAEADESGRVADRNITNVTTAHFVLATRATGDGSIDNAEELAETAALVDANAALELSAAIKLVVESIDGITLPGAYADTQALAEAIVDGSSTFLADVELTNPGVLNDAVDLVLNDGNATIPWQQDRVPGVYLHREGFSLFAMFAGGTGLASSYDRDAVIGFQWAVNDAGKLVIAYLTGSAERDVVTLLGHTGNVLSVMVEEMGQGDESLNDEPSTVLRFPFAEGFTDENAPGSYSTMGAAGHLKVFLADHTGYDLDLVTGAQGEEFIWEVGADGVLWIFDVTGASQSQARILGGAEHGGLHLLITETGPDGLTDHMKLITVRRTDVIATTPGDVDAPDLTLAGNSYVFSDGDQIDVFHFRADGQVRQVAQHENDNGFEFVDRRGDWSMVDDQTIRIWLEGADEAEDARVVAGLGQDEMMVQTPEDIAEGTERIVTRILPVSAAEVLGAYYLLDEGGAIVSESVQMFENFTGEYRVDGVLDTTFDWSLDERGGVVISLRSDDSFDARTLTLRRLAGSDADQVMRLVVERRRNGVLTADPNSGRAIALMSVFREG